MIAAPDGYAAISAAQQRAFEAVVPLNTTLELTTDCNIRCLHCYNFDRDEPRQSPGGSCGSGAGRAPLSLQEILALLASLRDAGCLFLSLTGGEVLSYPHLFAVLDRAQELNLAVQLLTNGTLLRPGVAARLASYRNLLGVSVSLYGATPEVHDGITQIRGSWRRTWDGVDRLRALGMVVRLKFILMRQNAHEVAAMRAAADAAGFPYMIDMTITSRHDGSRGSLATRVEDDQLVQLHRGPLRDMLGDRPRSPKRRDRRLQLRPRKLRRARRTATSPPASPCPGWPGTFASSRLQRSGRARPSSSAFGACAPRTTPPAPPVPTRAIARAPVARPTPPLAATRASTRSSAEPPP